MKWIRFEDIEPSHGQSVILKCDDGEFDGVYKGNGVFVAILEKWGEDHYWHMQVEKCDWRHK